MKRGTLTFDGNTVQVWVEMREGGIFASSQRPKEYVKFKTVTDQYLADIVPNFKPASQSSITSIIETLNQTFGQLPLNKIDTERIQQYVTGFQGSPKTLRNLLSVMRMVWRKARAWKYVKENPFEFLSLPRMQKTEARYLSLEEAREIVRKTDGQFRMMLQLCAELGCRGGELVSLMRDDIDLANQIVHIRRSAFRGVLQTPKTTNALRAIHISRTLACNLEFYLTQLDLTRRDWIGPDTTRPDENLLFSNKRKVWSNGEVVRRLKPVLGQRTGLHAFRHMNKSLMQSLGVPEYLQDERMGHARQGIGARYTHSSPEDHKKYAEIIGQTLCTENVLAVAMGAD
jgi:integrase